MRNDQFFPSVAPKILRREDFVNIMHLEKSPYDQLGCLLGMLQGFRTTEVLSAKFEHFHLDKGVVYVLDSKDYRKLSSDHKFYILPLRREVAYAYLHCEDKSGYILKHHKHFVKYNGKALSKMAWKDKVRQWAYDVGALDYKIFNGTLFRVFYAKEWMRERGDIVLLSKSMRHHNVLTTVKYLQKFVYLEDLRAEMEKAYVAPKMEDMQKFLTQLTTSKP